MCQLQFLPQGYNKSAYTVTLQGLFFTKTYSHRRTKIKFPKFRAACRSMVCKLLFFLMLPNVQLDFSFPDKLEFIFGTK